MNKISEKRTKTEYQIEVWKDDERMTYANTEIASANVSSSGLLQIVFKDGSEITYSGFPFRILKYQSHD